MTLPGGNSGDKPGDPAGEELPTRRPEHSRSGSDPGPYDAPPGERIPPPAYEHPPMPPAATLPPSDHSAPPPPPNAGYPYPGFPGNGPPPYGYAEGYPPPPGYGQPRHTTTNTMAIASLAISVLGIVPFCGGILSIVGITLGAVALSQIKETRQEGYGLAVGGIVVGVAMLIVGLIWTIFALR